MMLFAIMLVFASSLHTDLEELDAVQEARSGRRSLSQSLNIFNMLMVGDPQYTSEHCTWNDPGTANYIATDDCWCKDHGPFSSRWHRTNNYMNAVEDALFSRYLENRKPAGANILGDLTDYGKKYERESYEAKIHDIQAQGAVRIWQSLGNHDTVSILRAKDDLLEGGNEGGRNNIYIRDMIKKMKSLLPQWHQHKLGGREFHDGVYHYDTNSNSFLYRKNQVMFINLQLHPAMHHIDYWCKDCRDHAGHYHVGKWKQVLFSPIDWFERMIDQIQRAADGRSGSNGMGPVRGIVLMYHYSGTYFETSYGGETVDSGRWQRIRDLMSDHNRNNPHYPPFIAVFNGHIHSKCGYQRDNDLKWMTKSNVGNTYEDVPRFYSGSADFSCFLTVKFRPWKRYFEVYANYFDADGTGGADASKKSTGFKRKCVHKDGKHASNRCTRWHFDGKRTEF